MVGIFPNEDAIVRLIGAILLEQNDEWAGQRASLHVVIIAGEQDKVIDIDAQSARLHSDIPHSIFHRLPGNGHMIQQTATEEVMSALRELTDALKASA